MRSHPLEFAAKPLARAALAAAALMPGAISRTAVALLFGRAMIETRGLAWPVALHFAIDVVIFTFLAIASVA